MEPAAAPPTPSAPPSSGTGQLRQFVVVVVAVLVTLAIIRYWPYRSPIPAVTLGEQGPLVPDEKAYKQKYDFTQDYFTKNIPVWEKALAPYKGKPDIQYLEVGVHEGRSLVWLLENILTDPTSRVTALDLYPPPDGEELKARLLRNIDKVGAKDRVTLMVGYSQNELRKLPLKSFDIVYIDASHTSWDVLEDAVLAWRLVKPGGLLMFDDYRWDQWVGGTVPIEEQPRDAIDAFYRFYGRNFDVVHNDYQLILRKRKNSADVESGGEK